MRKRTRDAKKYQRSLEDEDNNIAANHKTYVKRSPSVKSRNYQRLNENNVFQDISNNSPKRKTPPIVRKLRKRNRVSNRYRTVFD